MKQSRLCLERTIRQMRALQQTERNLLVMSDFHISEGFDETEGRWSINEDFFFDDQFARLLQFADRQRARHYGDAPWRLILNGDIFDFRQVGVPREGELEPDIAQVQAKEAKIARQKQKAMSRCEKAFGPGPSRLMSRWRVSRVYQGHPGFFQALAWFVARGNQVVFIKGNHDIEMHWLKVQMGLKHQLAEAYAKARTGGLYELDWAKLPKEFGRAEKDRVFFLPWNYYEPGRVYIEHGQQFRSDDSEAHVLWPMLPWDEKMLEFTWGDLFGRYVVNKFEELFPLIDNMKPHSKGAEWLIRKGIPQFLARGNFWGDLKSLFGKLGSALGGLRCVFEKNWNHWKKFEEFAAEREAELGEYGEQIGLDAACATALEKLKRSPKLRSKWLMPGWFIIRLFEGGALVLLSWLAIGFLRVLWRIGAGANILALVSATLVRSAAGLIVGAVGLWGLKRAMQRPEERLMNEALQIHKALHEHGKSVKYVFLGHDHNAYIKRLDAELAKKHDIAIQDRFYANSGTWTAVITHETELVHNAQQFAFLRLVGDTAQLMRWNDSGGSWEPVVLQH